ncbi:rhamnan synthesis F family protein [Aureimonas frigidaquae]|uniref:rhamnan synthesis F family protein n=1 Tax=Aureimonas frigidaquae TaxID=424757 RepID=UPI000ADD98C7|nr:rhamnan synthesis F family protein [Aureimonas frigidaquae]
MSSVVVFVHVHYAEVWPGIRQRLEDTMAVPFRLVVTTTFANPVLEEPTTSHLTGMQVHQVENRGRDVLPFLKALSAAGPFEIGLKLHGKRSVHRLDGDAWRDALLDSLLPGRDKVAEIVTRMHEDPRIALIAPENALCAINKHIAGNTRAMKAVAKKLSLDLGQVTERTPYFSAGTMFWFRREAILPAAVDNIDPLFAAENRQTDGTAAHALERLFTVIAEEGGKVTLPVDALSETSVASSLDQLRSAARSRVDRDQTYVLVPNRVVAFALRHAGFVVPLYLGLPVPLRRLIKSSIRVFVRDR